MSGERKPANVTLRLRSDLHEKLVAEADARGFSLNEAINRVIEAHFDQPALVDALAARLEQRTAERAKIRHEIEGGDFRRFFDERLSFAKTFP